jgi:Na+/H+ antiporter NhaC
MDKQQLKKTDNNFFFKMWVVIILIFLLVTCCILSNQIGTLVQRITILEYKFSYLLNKE